MTIDCPIYIITLMMGSSIIGLRGQRSELSFKNVFCPRRLFFILSNSVYPDEMPQNFQFGLAHFRPMEFSIKFDILDHFKIQNRPFHIYCYCNYKLVLDNLFDNPPKQKKDPCGKSGGGGAKTIFRGRLHVK